MTVMGMASDAKADSRFRRGADFGLGLIPSTASAATCSDHSTQAEAQRAADTRDADGDGIYCESLPSPCAKPGSSTALRSVLRSTLVAAIRLENTSSDP